MFKDESSKLFVGRFLKLEEIEPWVLAQNMGDAPANLICHHHTYIPTLAQWKGMESLLAIFRYYERKGWRKGVGPHVFVADNGIYIATHPRHDGIGVAGFNHRVIHIECIGNFDNKPLGGQQLENLYVLNRALAKNPGIPINRSKHFFHRDKSPKSCPGKANTKELLIDKSIAKPKPKEEPKVKDYKGRWSEPFIDEIIRLGIMKGYADGTFRPATNVTREELAKVIYETIKLINPSLVKKI